MTDQELQTLRNLGNEAEAAADEIETLRQRVKELEYEAGYTKPVDPGDNSYPNPLDVAATLRNCDDDLLTEARFVLWQGRELAALKREKQHLINGIGRVPHNAIVSGLPLGKD